MSLLSIILFLYKTFRGSLYPSCQWLLSSINLIWNYTIDQCSSRPVWLLWMVDCTYIHLIELTLWHVLASCISSPLQQLISSITYLIACFPFIQKKGLLSAKSAFNSDHNSKPETIQSSSPSQILQQIWLSNLYYEILILNLS